MGSIRFLILGASSRIGKYFWKKLGSSAVGTYNSHAFSGGIRFATQRDQLEDIVDLNKFSHAIILLGLTDMNRCALDIEYSTFINVTSIKRVIDVLAKHNISIVFASSDLVFDGTSGNYKESDTPRPILTYGKQKFAVEQYLTRVAPRYLIARFGKVYGMEHHDGTVLTWIKQIMEKKSIKIATDQVFSPIWVEDIVTGVVKLIEEGKTGIYHVAGPERLSRSEFFNMVAAAIGRKSEVRYSSIDDFDLPEKRPHDVSLNIEKLIADIGFTPRHPAQVLKLIL